MKISSVHLVSFIVSLSALACVIILGLFLNLDTIQVLLSSLGCMVAVYIVTRVVVSRYVVYRIKPIYQIMLERNIKSKELVAKSAKNDLVNSIESELSLWAERQSEEISRLKHMENYRKEFLGNVTHELKTPLFTIQGYLLTLLDDELEDKEMAMKFLKNADNSLERLINIVKDLEDISRLEMDVMRLNRVKFDIVKLTCDVMDRMSTEAGAREIKLICNQDKEINVYADYDRIEQVMINLISNSIKYGKRGGRTDVKFIDGFNKIVIEVTDNGVGIASEDIPRIFERFFRADKSRSRETGGTGLGLAIVKHIIEAHSEKINVRSTKGHTTTFSFALNKYLD